MDKITRNFHFEFIFLKIYDGICNRIYLKQLRKDTMEDNNCFQCAKELIYKVNETLTKCPHCGAMNEALSSKEPINLADSNKRSKSKKSSDEIIYIAAIASTLIIND